MLIALGWFWHPLNGTGYQFWSGIGSDIGEVAIVGGLITLVRQRTCHVHRCWRPCWHAHPEHGHPVCKHHHPHARTIRADGSVDAPPEGDAT